MCLPDQNNIARVRDALWSPNEGACVMVGAGFSRNAFCLLPDTDVPPTVDNLSEAFSKELDLRQGLNERGGITNQLIKPDDLPLLAQKYEDKYGRDGLNQFLKDQIPDVHLKPTDVHKSLLSLPWRDVFTTNWDTLLERTCELVHDQKYSILRNKDEIPLAKRPRIVKLHGSFPANFPLICTQADYETYPEKFAPFVNTVQQAMMETVFLLIGFSGDDQNFIRWTVWVCDNLEESAPRMYLAGWLNLSLGQRKALESRNVEAIDLAQYAKFDRWPEHLRHEYATKWILQTLERGEPYMVTNWPSPTTKEYPTILEDPQPVVVNNADEPKKEPHPSECSGDILARVEKIIRIWAHNRKLYPGWLAVPVSVRGLTSYITDAWESEILSALQKLKPVPQLRTIYELIWRREILMDPLLSDIESAAQDILQKIDCEARTVAGERQTEIEWSEVRRKYRNILLALATTARLRFDHETFEKRLVALEEFRNDDTDVAQRIHHERCLWAIYSLDYNSLSELLRNWSPEDCDPFWIIRKATLLYEMNRVCNARELADRAYSAIKGIPDNIRSVFGPSREGWALELKAVIESTISWMRYRPDQEASKYPPDLSDLYSRRRELAAKKCDTQSEIQGYVNALAPHDKSEVAPAFDLGIKALPGIRLSNAEQERWRAALRTIRLSEVAGLPAVTFDTLKSAAEELSVSEPEMAMRMVLRALSYDGDDCLKRILSRSQVAVMSVEVSKRLAVICHSIIEYASPRIGVVDTAGRALFWPERMRVAMEVLSRLVVRLSSEEVENVFDHALWAYHEPRIIRHSWLCEPLCNMLSRSWLSLPKQRRTARILDLLSAPILGVGNTTFWHRLYPIPDDLLHEHFTVPDRTNDNEDHWRQVFGQLILALNEGGKARMRSAKWVFHIASWKRLTDSEAEKVAQALWNRRYVEPTGLPRETGLLEWVFMVLPEPSLGLAERRFRKKYLSDGERVKGNEREFGNTLCEVGIGLLGLRLRKKPLALSETDERFLIDILRRWTDTPMPVTTTSSVFASHRAVDQYISEINGVSAILVEVQTPLALAEKLYQKMNLLIGLGFPAYGFIPGLSMVLKNRVDELVEILKLGLMSQNEERAEAALVALDRWLALVTDPASRIQAPPDDLVLEIGNIVATPRKETLGLALQGAKWIYDRGADQQIQIIQDLTLRGLKVLLNELQYDRKNGWQNHDLPYLRNYCVQLALSLCKHGLRNNDTIDGWLQAAKNDPLPELRYAIDPV